VPLVCTVLDVIPLAIPQYRSGFRNRLYTSLVAAAARGAAHILTISEDGRQDIARRIHIPLERITVTHLAVDSIFQPEHDAAAEQTARERYGLKDVDEFVLYLGSYPTHKNVKLLLAAYTYVEGAVDIPLVLAGHTPSQWGTERFPDLPAYIEELHLKESVRWIGPVDEADKSVLYRMAKVFAIPSRYEGFGLGPLEAMAIGTPVVACNISSIPEVTGDAAFLVDPDDSTGMGGAILSLLTDDKLAEDLRQRGLQRAQEFSWRKTAEQTWEVYQRLARSD
jgi:glycosyltransferase involved in cell wall biosynthesis